MGEKNDTCLGNMFVLVKKFPGSFCNCKEFKIRF